MVDRGSFSDHSVHIQNSKAQIVNGQKVAISQDLSDSEFKESLEVAFNPVAMRNRFERLESRIKKTGKEEVEKTGGGDEDDFAILETQEVADQFEEKNPELSSASLMSLRNRVSKKTTFDQLLSEVLETFPDVALADESLDFLISTSKPELAEKLKQVKEHLNTHYGREIRAGQNIMKGSQAFAKKELGSATSLRDLYRDITGNPREPSTLFAELATKYTFAKMKAVIAFVLHSLGQDLRSKGSSIEKGELHRLLSESRSMQAILGVYRYFQSRMSLIQNSFLKNELILPSRINFESLSKSFMKFILERYPSSDKLLQLLEQLGAHDDLVAEIILLTQMKDAVRLISPRLYRSDQHKQDILATFLDTLEDLEDELEEEDDDDDDETEKKP
jgi:type III secretion protein W